MGMREAYAPSVVPTSVVKVPPTDEVFRAKPGKLGKYVTSTLALLVFPLR
jgi:hypothetical protein